MVSRYFFSNPPYTLNFSLFFEKSLPKVLQQTKNHTTPEIYTAASPNQSICSSNSPGTAQSTDSMSSIYQQSITDSLDINNESQLLTFVQKMKTGMSRFLEATKLQA